MLKIGDRMPEFEVVDQDGNVVSSKDFIECWRGLSRRWTQRTTLPRFSDDSPGGRKPIRRNGVQYRKIT